MLSSNNNSEIDINSTYTKYGLCRCCVARGQHRDLDKEYYYNNLKEVYRDIFAKCFNLSLSQHNLISSLICENCVQRLREASSFRIMVAASEELLLNTVLFKKDLENHTKLVDARQNFTTDVKIGNNLDIIRMISSPDVFQDESKSSAETEQVNGEGWVNDKERTNKHFPLDDNVRTNDGVPLNDNERTYHDVPLKDKELTNDDVLRVNEKERLNDEERINDDDGWSDDFDNRMSDDDGWSDGSDDPTNDDVPLNNKEQTNDDVRVNEKERVNDEERMNDDDGWSDDFDDRMNDDDGWSDNFDETINDIRINDNERTNDDVPLNDKEPVNDYDEWSDVFVDRTNDDDDDLSTDTDHELVIDEDRASSSGTNHIVTDEDLDKCGSIFNSTITRSETNSVDDEPSAMVQGEKKLLSKFAPVRPLPLREQLMKICPKFNEHLKKLQCKTVKLKSIERVLKTKTPKENEKSTIFKPKLILSDKQALAASIPGKLVEPKSMKWVSKSKFSDKQALKPSIPEKLVESQSNLSDKRALPAILIISMPDELAESNTILSDKQALPASIPAKLVKQNSMERVSKTETLSVKEKRAIAIEQKHALASDATTLFQFSNATAFKNKNRDGYPCFYCLEVFKYNRLKEHQEVKHAAAKGSIYTLLAKYHAADFVVYAEITDLKCTICKKDIKDLYELREHLSKKHGKNMHKIPDRVIPFKLQEKDFDCQVCGRIFGTFSLVERHMNTHFGTFVCQTCGAPFITKHRLAVHTYSLHKNAKEKCKVCKKSFSTFLKMRIHYETVHEKNKTIRCSNCPEKFSNFFSRMIHLAEAHGAARHLYQCDECAKGFTRITGLHDHVNRCHMKDNDKKIKCETCSFQCYTKSELWDHNLVHSPQEFGCDICKKVYSRRKSLAMHFKIHMTRI